MLVDLRILCIPVHLRGLVHGHCSLCSDLFLHLIPFWVPGDLPFLLHLHEPVVSPGAECTLAEQLLLGYEKKLAVER